MKYIEVTGWGNKRKHLIPLNKIIDFNFEGDYTTITLTSGKSINATESESTIREMLSYHNANVVNEETIRTFYEGLAEFQAEQEPPYYYEGDDELPF
jgi:DNA-binding LytR/AlgR family response regulator